MAKKEKACLHCRAVYEGDKCSNCGQTPATDNFKGKVAVFNPEKSEIADAMAVKDKGDFAIKTK